jgi:hypothetical protein
MVTIIEIYSVKTALRPAAGPAVRVNEAVAEPRAEQLPDPVLA